MKICNFGVVESANCVNQELFKLGIVEIGKLENCGIRPKFYPVCYKFYLMLATVYRNYGDTQWYDFGKQPNGQTHL